MKPLKNAQHNIQKSARPAMTEAKVTYQRRCTGVAIAAVVGFIAFPMITGRAHDPPPFSVKTPAAAPDAAPAAGVPAVGANAGVPLVPETDRACLTPPQGL